MAEDEGAKRRQELADQLLRRVETGEYIKELRDNQGLSLAQLGKKLEVTAHYLSELERGIKEPSDHLIRRYAEHFRIDENILFSKLGRVPLMAREELDNFPVLQKTLTEINRNNKLDDEEKEELYRKIYSLYQEYIKKD